MRFCIYSSADAGGVIYQRIIPFGKAFIIILASGNGMVCGIGFTETGGRKCGLKQANINIRQQALWIRKVSSATAVAGEEHGFDAGKNIKGRKRHIIVDTLELLLAVGVTSASIQDRDGAKMLFGRLGGAGKKLRKVWVEGGYRGLLLEWVKLNFSFVLEVILRSDDQTGFVVLPRRWVVERTFAWLSNHRRLSKDDERFCQTSETFIYVAMTRLMLRRLVPF